MTLLIRTIVAKLITLVVVGVIVHLAVSRGVLAHFESLENRRMSEKLERARIVIDDDVASLGARGKDWVRWSNLYEMVDAQRDGASAHVDIDREFDVLQTDLIALANEDGKLLKGAVRFEPGGELCELEPHAIHQWGIDFSALCRCTDAQELPKASRRGLIGMDGRTMMLACVPIVSPDQSGPCRGVAIFGRFIGAAQCEHLNRLTGSAIDFLPANDPGVPSGTSRRTLTLPSISGTTSWWSLDSSNSQSAWTALTGMNGERAGWLRLTNDREIAAFGATTTVYVQLLLLGLIVVSSAAFLLILNRWVLAPVRDLSTDVRRITHGDDGTRQVRLQGADEIGELAGCINQMLVVQRSQEKRLASWARELDEARNDAVAASKAKSEFLANMSHEIRTPMTAILGFADLIVEPEGTGRDPAHVVASQRDAVRTIQRNGEHLLGLINDILDLSKVEAGKLVVENVSCSPIKIAQEVCALMEVRAKSQGVTLDLDIAYPLPAEFTSDPGRLRQILVNLVGNAIKFTPAAPNGPGIVRLKLACDEKTLSFLCVDSGIGISDELLPNLFKPFTQADASTTRRYGGTGLGLTICDRLAHALGGSIQVRRHAKPDQGTTFELQLPITPGSCISWITQPEQSLAASIQSTRPPESAAATTLTGSILLAEDGVDNQRLITHFLRSAGAKVQVAANGQDALDCLSREHFGLILMDMQMPVLDGYSAASAIRARGDHTPIIALTAHAMSGDRERCLSAGCDDYLTKPINRGQLIATCRKWLQAAPSATPATSAQ